MPLTRRVIAYSSITSSGRVEVSRYYTSTTIYLRGETPPSSATSTSTSISTSSTVIASTTRGTVAETGTTEPHGTSSLSSLEGHKITTSTKTKIAVACSIVGVVIAVFLVGYLVRKYKHRKRSTIIRSRDSNAFFDFSYLETKRGKHPSSSKHAGAVVTPQPHLMGSIAAASSSNSVSRFNSVFSSDGSYSGDSIMVTEVGNLKKNHDGTKTELKFGSQNESLYGQNTLEKGDEESTYSNYQSNEANNDVYGQVHPGDDMRDHRMSDSVPNEYLYMPQGRYAPEVGNNDGMIYSQVVPPINGLERVRTPNDQRFYKEMIDTANLSPVHEAPTDWSEVRRNCVGRFGFPLRSPTSPSSPSQIPDTYRKYTADYNYRNPAIYNGSRLPPMADNNFKPQFSTINGPILPIIHTPRDQGKMYSPRYYYGGDQMYRPPMQYQFNEGYIMQSPRTMGRNAYYPQDGYTNSPNFTNLNQSKASSEMSISTDNTICIPVPYQNSNMEVGQYQQQQYQQEQQHQQQVSGNAEHASSSAKPPTEGKVNSHGENPTTAAPGPPADKHHIPGSLPPYV